MRQLQAIRNVFSSGLSVSRSSVVIPEEVVPRRPQQSTGNYDIVDDYGPNSTPSNLARGFDLPTAKLNISHGSSGASTAEYVAV